MNRTTMPAALAAFLAGGQAAAQTPDAGTAPPPKPAKVAIEQMVVTAQSRAQKLQTVPISVATFGKDFIRQTGSQNLADLSKYTPGLDVDNTSTTQPKYSIRGTSTDDFGVGTDPTVGIYVDGVYSARSGAALVFFNDVQRVEVLKGPQGTLFGRNTAAGAISVISNPPVFKYEGVLDYKVGNYNKQQGTITLNVPFSDTFAVRINAMINRRDGFIDSRYDGRKYGDENNSDVRIAARWRPLPDTDITLAWDHDNTNVAPPVALGIGPYSFNGGDPLGPVYQRVINGGESRRLDDGVITVRQGIGDGLTLTSLSAYKGFTTNNRESETGSPLIERYFDTNNLENNHSWYQEFKLNGTWGPVDFVAGTSYYQERAKQASWATGYTDSIQTSLVSSGYPPAIDLIRDLGGFDLFGLPWVEYIQNHGRYKAWSVFGDAIWKVTPKIDVTVGLRVTGDDKEFSWRAPPVRIPGASQDALDLVQSVIGNIVFPTAPIPQGQPYTARRSWTDASPRFVLAYHWTPDVMTYASASYGYKAGGFNSVQINSSFEPESVDNYELGLKSEWFDHRLRVNTTGYYYTYDNLQSLSLVTVTGAKVPSYVTQVGNATGKGIDFEVIAVPARDLTLSLTGGYIDVTWDKRVQGDIDLAGQPKGTPEWRVVAGIDYVYPLGRLGKLRFRANHSYTSPARRNAYDLAQQASIASYVNFNKLPGYFGDRNLTDLRVTWSDERDRYMVAMWAQNLFDNRYVTGINYITAATLQTPYVRPEFPRFWGAELTYRF